MKKEKYFEVSYRNEFMATIIAETEEAIKRFCSGKYKNGKDMCYENISELHQEFFEVEECDFQKGEQEKILLQKYINGFATDEDKDKLIKLLMKSNNGKS